MTKAVEYLAHAVGALCGLAMRVADWLGGKRKTFWGER